nr:MAG TPA: HISTIDINE-CONTAINING PHOSPHOCARRIER PROTEIN (HPR).6A [Bacteriophage sp.]
MRIISQNGLLDVPYELIAISPYSKNMATIIGTFLGNDLGKGDRVYILAEYSTEEKAIKAMEMCRKNYAYSEFTRSVLCGKGETIGMLKDNIAEDYKDSVCDKFTFRFPADEEVE